MTDFVEWIPKHHGHKPLHWTPDTLTGLDGKNYVRQPNWAWIAGTTYYVPYEAVHGVRREVVEGDADAAPVDDLVKRMRDGKFDGYGYLVALLDEAADRIEALQADKAKMREALQRIEVVTRNEARAGDKGYVSRYGIHGIASKALQETGQ